MSLVDFRAPVRACAAWLGSPIAPLLAVVLCLMIGMGMVWSVLALYAETLGAGMSVVGLLLACFGGARLAVNLPAGMASERLGRRPAMLVGLACLAAGSLLAVWTSTVPLLLVSLLVQGAGSAAFITAALAAVADLGTPETRLRDMAAYQAATMIGISIGPALGGLSAAAFGYKAPFLLQAVMAVVAVLALFRLALPPPRRGIVAASGGGAMALRGALGLFLITYGVFFARIASNWVLLPLVARESVGLDLGSIGLVLTAGAIANLAALPLTSPAARKLGRNGALVGTSLATIVALILLATAHSPIHLWIAALLLGAASGIAAPTLSAIAADAAPPGRLGAAMGLMRTGTDLGIVSGPVLVGIVVDRLGYGYAGGLLGAALVLAIATVVFLVISRRPA